MPRRRTARFFVRLACGDGTPILVLSISPTGKLSLRNTPGAATLTSAIAMPTGGWHQVVLHALVNGTSSSFDVSLDGTQVPDLSLPGQNLGTNPIATLQLGDTGGGTYDIDFDDVAVAQSPLP